MNRDIDDKNELNNNQLIVFIFIDQTIAIRSN
jgi:hypothetical protein